MGPSPSGRPTGQLVFQNLFPTGQVVMNQLVVQMGKPPVLTSLFSHLPSQGEGLSPTPGGPTGGSADFKGPENARGLSIPRGKGYLTGTVSA